jgi:hypothetical protein
MTYKVFKKCLLPQMKFPLYGKNARGGKGIFKICMLFWPTLYGTTFPSIKNTNLLFFNQKNYEIFILTPLWNSQNGAFTLEVVLYLKNYSKK